MRTETRFCSACERARRFHLLERPRQLLHVMADLVRDYVGLGKVPRRAEPSLQIAEEREVEVQPLVAGTVERPHSRLPHAARRAHLALVQDQRGSAVARARARGQRAPDILGAAEHLRDELPDLVFRRPVRRLAGRTGTLGRHLLRDVRNHRGIDAEEVGDERDDDAAHAQAAADHADAAPVLDVIACALLIQFH